MELYEFNKAGYASLPKMSKSRIEASREAIMNWVREYIDKSHSDYQCRYWLLLNNESHYYTFFVWARKDLTDLIDEVFSIAKELGTLKSIELNSTGDGYEFWITGHDEETRMYLFFNYDRGVIEA